MKTVQTAFLIILLVAFGFWNIQIYYGTVKQQNKTRSKVVDSGVSSIEKTIKNAFLGNKNANTDPRIIVDLSRKTNRPDDREILCRDSKKQALNTSVTLCYHDLTFDKVISYDISHSGIWESFLVDIWIKFLVKYPDSLVIDAGANLGVYSLFALKLKHHVISVEPFDPNVRRLRRAAQLEDFKNGDTSFSDRLTIVQNGLYIKRGERWSLAKNPTNTGGQGMQHKASNTSDPRFVLTTILFDDLIDLVPKRAKNAIMKIDIEGREPDALSHCEKMFARVQFDIIFMEWGHKGYIAGDRNRSSLDIIKLMNRHNLKAYSSLLVDGAELLNSNYTTWPWDIIWKRDGITL
jgi:FkbM family methyltransferase